MNKTPRFLVSLLLLFACHLPCFGAFDPVAVYLTWQRSPESTMTIHWISTKEVPEDLVEYRQSDDTPWLQVLGSHIPMPTNAPYLIHSIELTNLLPGTTYTFRISSDGVPYKFQTMPATLESNIRFIAGGDMYHDDLNILQQTTQQAAKTNPLFALIGGDIAYASNERFGFIPQWMKPWIDKLSGQKPDRWLAWLISWKNNAVTPDGRLIPILPVLGNHDTCGRFNQTPAEAPFFYSLFSMPGKQGYNVLDFGNYMTVALLDSGHTHPVAGAQTDWLHETLKQRVNIPHKFALYHVPAYPSVRNANNEHSTQVRKHWVPVFEAHRLTAAFENHDHAYKRTLPIFNNQPAPINEGVIYLGDGAWGVDKVRKIKHAAQKWYLAKHAAIRHFLLIDLSESSRQVRAISTEGEIIDDFTW